MTAIYWSEDYSIGISEIDAQHERLFDIVNLLHDAMRQGKGYTVIQDVLRELNEYITHHFSTEEQYFRKFKFPHDAEHRKGHTAFAKRLKELEWRHAQGDATVRIEALSFLVDWLKEHVNGDDREYAAYFKAQGLI